MTPAEARAYVTWFRNNHLPKESGFVRLNSGREIVLDSMNDDEAVFVAQQFEAMFDAARGGKWTG
jgi:hypothetical protein